MIMASKLILLLSLCALAANVVVAHHCSKEAAHTYHLIGRVYCDTCACGFETKVTHYIPGAKVKLECKNPEETGKDTVVYTANNVTDADGYYTFNVPCDHTDHICDVKLVKSPWPHCKKPDPGRDSCRAILTDHNGLASPRRHCNNMGFMTESPLPVCRELLKYYLQSVEESGFRF